jgi:hypothetical protein
VQTYYIIRHVGFGSTHSPRFTRTCKIFTYGSDDENRNTEVHFIQQWKTGGLVNNESETKWKEAAVAYLKALSQNVREATERKQKER